MRYPLIACGILLIALMSESWGMPHYAAPATGLLFLIIVQCTRHLALLDVEGSKAWPLSDTRNSVVVIWHFDFAGCDCRSTPGCAKKLAARKSCSSGGTQSFAKHTPGKHLVIVDYGPRHDVKQEWIYNLADIDASPVVWARDMGEHDNQELLQYFSDRKVWRLQADETPPKLSPYLASH